MWRAAIKKVCLWWCRECGRYRPYSRSEKKLVQTESVGFVGDIPSGAGQESSQQRMEYETPRALEERVSGLLYTETGAGWKDGVLHESYSLRPPSLVDLWRKPTTNGAKVVKQGTVVQVETPYTYGDWVSEHMMCLVKVDEILTPLLLPQHLAERKYVQRDLNRLGVPFEAVSGPTRIENALVLHKTRHSHYVTHEEVISYRKKLSISPPIPDAGSILYLSRKGVIGDGVRRTYPSERVEKALQPWNVKVVDTSTAQLEDYLMLAPYAETVVADFGSAYMNVLEWNTKKLIVLFTDEWWDSCTLFLTQALGMEEVVYVRIDNEMPQESLREAIAHHLPVPDTSLVNI